MTGNYYMIIAYTKNGSKDVATLSKDNFDIPAAHAIMASLYIEGAHGLALIDGDTGELLVEVQ